FFQPHVNELDKHLGLISESRMTENSEYVKPEMRFSVSQSQFSVTLSQLLWQHTLLSHRFASCQPEAERVAGSRNMACPLVNEVVEVEAQCIQRLLCKEKVIRACLDVSLEECLYERYCFHLPFSFILTICSTQI
ncbi:hypothetical protein P7M41_26445, partial [Vibrio parahaemolyticus]|nr:hypothetical protein [Vibrio parahaemolyticus]